MCVQCQNVPAPLCLRPENQLNAPASINRYTENVRFGPTTTKRDIRKPSNLQVPVYVGERGEGFDASSELVVIQKSECGLCAKWTNICPRQQHPNHTIHTPVFAACNPNPNKCTRFNQPMHRKRSVGSYYAYEQYTRKPSSDLQNFQIGELAEGVGTSRELIVLNPSGVWTWDAQNV